ncbi:hypothetical protein vseg_007114 [Gypsophila vaccaria]
MTTTTTTANHRNNHQQPPSQQYYFTGTPSYYSPTSSSPSLIKGCCCCLFLLFSLLSLLVLAVILAVILAVKPKKPHFDLQEVAVQNLAINGAVDGGDGATVSLSVRLIFAAANGNKVGIKYGESRFTVMYRGVPLGRGSVPGFYQPAESVKVVTTTVTVDRVSLMQADGVDLVKDASLYDKVELRVLGDVSAKIRVVGFDSPAVQVSVDCAIVISPRKQELTYKQCGFDGLSV